MGELVTTQPVSAARVELGEAMLKAMPLMRTSELARGRTETLGPLDGGSSGEPAGQCTPRYCGAGADDGRPLTAD